MMEKKIILLSMLLLAGITCAIEVLVTLGAFSFLILPPSDMVFNNVLIPQSTPIYICANSTYSTNWCYFLKLNASSSENNITLNFTGFQGVGSVMNVSLVSEVGITLVQFTNSTNFTFPAGYINGSAFAVKMVRVIPNNQVGTCHFDISGD